MSPVSQPESMSVTDTLYLQYVNELCPLPLILIRRDHIPVMPLQAIGGRIDIEEVYQPVKHLFTQFLSLSTQAFLVFPHGEANDGVALP